MANVSLHSEVRSLASSSPTWNAPALHHDPLASSLASLGPLHATSCYCMRCQIDISEEVTHVHVTCTPISPRPQSKILGTSSWLCNAQVRSSAMARSFEEECSYLERLSSHTYRIKKGFVPNMNVRTESSFCCALIRVTLFTTRTNLGGGAVLC